MYHYDPMILPHTYTNIYIYVHIKSQNCDADVENQGTKQYIWRLVVYNSLKYKYQDSR